jgi:hypothetical protein
MMMRRRKKRKRSQPGPPQRPSWALQEDRRGKGWHNRQSRLTLPFTVKNQPARNAAACQPQLATHTKERLRNLSIERSVQYTPLRLANSSRKGTAAAEL